MLRDFNLLYLDSQDLPFLTTPPEYQKVIFRFSAADIADFYDSHRLTAYASKRAGTANAVKPGSRNILPTGQKRQLDCQQVIFGNLEILNTDLILTPQPLYFIFIPQFYSANPMQLTYKLRPAANLNPLTPEEMNAESFSEERRLLPKLNPSPPANYL